MWTIFHFELYFLFLAAPSIKLHMDLAIKVTLESSGNTLYMYLLHFKHLLDLEITYYAEILKMILFTHLHKPSQFC